MQLSDSVSTVRPPVFTGGITCISLEIIARLPNVSCNPTKNHITNADQLTDPGKKQCRSLCFSRNRHNDWMLF